MPDDTKPPLPAHVQSEVDFLHAVTACIINGSPIRSMVFCMLTEAGERKEFGSMVSLVDANHQPIGPSYGHNTMMYGKAMEDALLLNAALNTTQEAVQSARDRAAVDHAFLGIPPSTTVVSGDLPEILEPPPNAQALEDSGYPAVD